MKKSSYKTVDLPLPTRIIFVFVILSNIFVTIVVIKGLI